MSLRIVTAVLGVGLSAVVSLPLTGLGLSGCIGCSDEARVGW